MRLEDKITLCLTIGRRPDLLRQTLETLVGLPPLPVLAINDFGDAETNAVFREMCQQGRLIEPGRHLGHHGAVDLMYAEVKTPYRGLMPEGAGSYVKPFSATCIRQ